MRNLVTLLLVGLLAGCACSAEGCDNRLRFHPEVDLQLNVAYEVHACVDGMCQAAMLEQVGNAWDIEDGLTLRADDDNIDLALGAGDFGGAHAVTFAVRDAAGVILAEFDGPIELTRSEPNGGGFCGPTCWSADIGS